MRALYTVFLGYVAVLLMAGTAFAQTESLAAWSPELTIESPDGEIIVGFGISARGEPAYNVSFQGREVVAPSKMGLRFKDHASSDRDILMGRFKTDSRDVTWEQPWGERRYVQNHYNEMSIILRKDAAHFLDSKVRFRVFNDGIGFRYEIKGHEGEFITITDEVTEFNIPEDSTAWWIPARKWNRYEYLYNATTAGEIEMAHTPMTARTPDGVHISIHEAALMNYSGMSLENKRPGVLKANLAPWYDGTLVKGETSITSPWRTMQIGDKATDLLNSDLILNLNAPNTLGDVSYVEPGKYIGIWWAMHIRDRSWGQDTIHGATTEETKRYMDFAAAHGFDGVLVEGWNTGWDGDWYTNGDLFSFTESYEDFDIKAVTDYGLSKGVRLIGHHETSGSLSNYESQMDDAFDLYEAHGVRQIKTGYVADAGGLKWVDENDIARYAYHDGQYNVEHHIRVLEAAADHKISINAHEPVKDTGLRRTYPNWISREGARGMEFNAWGVPPNGPDHVSILAFTRMLSGPMDFTPGIFELRPNELPPLREDMPRSDPASRIETTLAKQLALYVVLYSPIQMAADLPEHYDARPEAFQFIKDVVTDWDQSIALDGEIGGQVVFARKARESDEWFLGAVTGSEAMTLDVDLDFLDTGTTYLAEIYRDGPDADYDSNPYDMIIESYEVTKDWTLQLPLGRSGGAAVRLVPNS